MHCEICKTVSHNVDQITRQKRLKVLALHLPVVGIFHVLNLPDTVASFWQLALIDDRFLACKETKQIPHQNTCHIILQLYNQKLKKIK